MLKLNNNYLKEVTPEFDDSTSNDSMEIKKNDSASFTFPEIADTSEESIWSNRDNDELEAQTVPFKEFPDFAESIESEQTDNNVYPDNLEVPSEYQVIFPEFAEDVGGNHQIENVKDDSKMEVDPPPQKKESDALFYQKNNNIAENTKESFSEKRDINELKQCIADEAAQKYNAEKRPYERAVANGVEGVRETSNGGVSFAETDYIYKKEDGEKCIVVIKATGNREKDFDQANALMGFDSQPENYVWHHLDNYNVEDGTITMELVADEAHNKSIPHSGGCAQYDAVNGPSYNPPHKGGA